MLSVAAANNEATQLLRDERAAEALVILENVLGSSPSASATSTLLANKGLCLEQLGRIDDAVAALEAALRACPTNQDAQAILRQLRATQLLQQAVVKAEKNEFSNALRLFEEAGNLDPREGTWLYNKARMLSKLGRYDDALEAALAVERDEYVYPLLGELLCKTERWTEAIDIIDEALAAGIELPASLLFNFGVALLKSGDLPRARTAFDDVVAYYPNYGLAYDALASIDAQEGSKLCKEGDFTAAIPKLYAAVRRTPKATTLYNLALALLKQRRAPEAKEQFEALLKLKHPHAQEGIDAATLMIEGGEYEERQEVEDEYYANHPSAAVAPQKRIYHIANEKGVGSLASQDDMVMLLSGIEEWVASALGPLEQRVVALEQAAEAAGGIVGSASEDRAVLQALFDRVTSLEDSSSGTSYDQGVPPPEHAAQFDAAMGVPSSLDKRLKSLEKLVFGAPILDNSVRQSAVSGSGLLADDSSEADEEHPHEQVDTSDLTMSMTARLAVQEQRFAKMATELEAQAKEIDKLKADNEKLHASLASANYAPPPLPTGRPSPFGTGGPPNFVITKGANKPRAHVPPMEGPNMLDELKAATKRRANKRRELGLTLQD